jgi:hypothetical protein
MTRLERSHRRLGAPALVFAIATGCVREPALLNVTLVGTASSSPQYFHGNCFAGWSVRAELRIAETNGVDAFLETVAFRLADEGSGREIQTSTFDASALEEIYGAGAPVIPGGSQRTFPISGPSPERPNGPLGVSGNVSVRDETGTRVEKSFALTTAIRYDESPPPSGGACAPP